MGLTYAAGPYRESTGIPSSAFSKGDLLTLDSNSSLSRIAETFESGDDIAAIAMASSLQSINNQVPVLIPERTTEFWSDCTIGSQFTAGTEWDFEYTGGKFFLTTSQTTVRAVVLHGGGSADVNDSNISRVRVALILNAGNVDYV